MKPIPGGWKKEEKEKDTFEEHLLLKHWKKKGLAENAPTKAIGEVNVWDSPHIYYPSWKSTPKSVVDDPNDSKDGTEQNVLMNYQFPNY